MILARESDEHCPPSRRALSIWPTQNFFTSRGSQVPSSSSSSPIAFSLPPSTAVGIGGKRLTLWRQFLKLVYLHPSKSNANSRSTDLRLDQPLGPWIGDCHLAVRRWPTYVSLDGSSLYHLRDGLVYYSSRNDARTRQAHRFPRESVIVPALPKDVIPASAILSPTTAILRPVPYPKTIPDPLVLQAVPPSLDFVNMLRALPEWQSSLHRNPGMPN
jgi:hypothetical protein